MDKLVALPELEIRINGESMSSRALRLLSDVRIQQRLSLPTVCELTFIDPQNIFSEEAHLEPGDELAVDVAGKPAALFRGQMTAVEYDYAAENQRIIRIRGYDRLHQLRKRQPVRAHIEVTLQDLAQSLASEIAIDIKLDEPGPVWHKLVQFRQSDLELLTELAQRCGLYFLLRDEVLHFFSFAGEGTASALQLGDTLLEARVMANADPACRSVQVTGWNPWRAEQHAGTVDAPRSARQVTLNMPPDKFSASGERNIIDKTLQDALQAESIAQAELDRRVAGEVVFSGVALGDPELQPGTLIEVNGLHDEVNGQYMLTGVTHLIDHRRGYVSLLDTAPPSPCRAMSHSGVSTLGIVTRVDDPDGLGRSRVLLPNFNNIETDWIPTVIPGAGKQKGVIALNTIDDRVLVHFINDDPAQAVILGGLYGSVEPPDAGVEQGEIKRYSLQLPGGQQLVLDDDKNSVSLSNGKGSHLQLTPGRVKVSNSDGSMVEISRDKFVLHSKVPLEIEAPGQAVTIRGQSIDLVRG